MTSWIGLMAPMDLLDTDLEVALEVLMELLDFHRAVPLLLTAEAGYSLEVEGSKCHSVDHLVALLLEGLLLLLECCLDLGFPLGALPPGLFGSPPPDPVPPLLDPSGGPFG